MVAALDGVVELLPPLAEPTITGADAVPLRTPTPATTPVPSPPPPRPATPPRSTALPPRPTPPHAAPTRVEDIADRPTRLFPGGGGETTRTFGAPTVTTPGPGYPRPPMPPLPAAAAGAGRPRWSWKKRILVWGGGLAVLAIVLGDDEKRREGEPQAAVATPASPDASASPADGDLQDGIERMLSTARATKEENIAVDVDEGTVTLSGEVADPATRQIAEALAESHPGVSGVRNEIEVTPRTESRRAERGVPVPSLPPILVPRGEHPPLGPPSPGTAQHEALQELLKEGKAALARGQPEEALAIYGSALALDGRNLEARRGIEQAAGRLRVQMRQWMPRGVPPVPPPPAAPRARPVPQPSPAGER
jgi:hypothetical protein